MEDVGRLRVGHTERQHVVGTLQQQYAEGRLTGPELEQRSIAARSASTFADLDILVADLPVPPPSRELRWVTATDSSVVGGDPDHPLVLSAGMSAHLQRGRWTVPAYLRLSGGMGSVKVDFQDAVCEHDVVDIAVSAGVGAVTLIVPFGWAVNTRQVRKGLGALSNQADEIPQPGKPLLVLHGSATVGSLRVRFPNWNDRRQYRRSLRRREAEGSLAAPETGGFSRTPAPRPTVPGRRGPQDAPPPRAES